MSEEYIKSEPALKREWVRQSNLIYGGLIAVGTVFLQPFLTATDLHRSAKVSVIAWAVAIPLLAALLMVGWQEEFRRRAAPSKVVSVMRALAQASAFTGLVAGMWHIWWVAGVTMLASGVVAMFVHSAGYSSLEISRWNLRGRKAKAEAEMTSEATPGE